MSPWSVNTAISTRSTHKSTAKVYQPTSMKITSGITSQPTKNSSRDLQLVLNSALYSNHLGSLSLWFKRKRMIRVMVLLQWCVSRRINQLSWVMCCIIKRFREVSLLLKRFIWLPSMRSKRRIIIDISGSVIVWISLQCLRLTGLGFCMKESKEHIWFKEEHSDILLTSRLWKVSGLCLKRSLRGGWAKAILMNMANRLQSLDVKRSDKSCKKSENDKYFQFVITKKSFNN